jgi:hypothetical protein
VDPLVPGRGSSSEDNQIVLLEDDKVMVSLEDEERFIVPGDDTLVLLQVRSRLEPWLELVSWLLLELEVLDRSCSAGRFLPRPRPGAGSWNCRGGVSDMIVSNRVMFSMWGAYYIYPKKKK